MQKLHKLNDQTYGLMIPISFLILWILLYFNLEEISISITGLFSVLNSYPKLKDAITFFVFETPKVFLLLLLIIYIVGLIRSFFSAEKTKKALEGKSLLTGNILASLLGVVTPFCSCSAIPLFLGFVQAGIPVGVTFSFLIAAPMINEVALVLLIGLFGWKVATIYLVNGILIAIVSGFILQKIGAEKYLQKWVTQLNQATNQEQAESKKSFSYRSQEAWNTVKEIIQKIWIYIILGIAIGAGAHGFVPDEALSSLLGQGHWYAVPLAILIGVPLYSNAAGIIPIVSVLIEKGVSLGTALAFMMSVVGLSLPEMIILKKVLQWKLIAIFIVIVTTGIILLGFLFNYLNL